MKVKDGPSEKTIDQLYLAWDRNKRCFSRRHNDAVIDKCFSDALMTYPLDRYTSSYARISLLKNYDGVLVDPLVIYERPYHRFIPVDNDLRPWRETIIHPDKDAANAGITQWRAATDVDVTKSKYYSSTFEGTHALSNNSRPPSKRKNATSPAHEPLDYYFITEVHQVHAVLERLEPYHAIVISIETTGPDPFIDRYG